MQTREITESLIKNIIKDCIDFDSRVVIIGKMDEYVTNALAEQDRIARAEERERCINAAQELVCKKCFENSAIGCRHANDVAKCELLIELREAMEGDEG